MMKKILFVLLASAVLVGFNSCKKTEKTEPVTGPVVEEVTTMTEEVVPENETTEVAPPAKSASDLLKEFENYVVAYAEANNNKTKDPKKYVELGQQTSGWVQDMERVKGELKPAELKKYEKLIKDLTNINTVK